MTAVRSPRVSQRIRSTILRAAFHLLYYQFAWAYDWVSRTFFRNQWRTWQRVALSRLRDLSGRDVLELGFGTGDLLYDLLRLGFRPAGIDLSPAMIRQTLRKSTRRGIAARLRLARARTEALPFADSSFDAVVSTFPSEYIAAPRTLAEIRRVLRPGGRLVIVPGARLLPIDAANRLLERFAGVVYGTPRDRAELEHKILEEVLFPGLAPRLEAAGMVLLEQGWQRFPTSVVYLIVARKPAAEVDLPGQGAGR